MRDEDYGARLLLKQTRKSTPFSEPRPEGFFFRWGLEIAIGILVLGLLLCAALNGVSLQC